MAQEFKITNVDPETKRWSSQFGEFITYNLLLDETGEEIVQQNKKPDSPAPKIGDVIYGNIERNAFGAKFKSEARVGTPSVSNSPVKASSDYEPGTNARWAVGMAYRAFIQVTGTPEDAGGNFPFDAVKQHALELVKMFELVKSSGSPSGLPTAETKVSVPSAAADLKSKLSNSDWVPDDDEIHS